MIRGAAAAAVSARHGHGSGLGLLGGKFGGSVASLLLLKAGAKETKTPQHLRMKERANSTPLAFASCVSPPNRLAPNQVLVQVFMVGLDGLDALVVRDKAGFLSNGSSSGRGGEGEYGFVPGRSFVGRAVECGFEVRNCFKGDWVYGLLDLTKVRDFYALPDSKPYSINLHL
jgi:NADPH:quinone reductase-like Zn-dependent oxidoreductase